LSLREGAVIGDNHSFMLALHPRAFRLLTMALLLVASAARAEDKTAAKERYAHARSLYDLGHFAEAAKEFEAAYELKNDPAFLYDLAQSYRQAGNPEQALHFYRTYLRYVPKPANRAEIDARIAALEQLLAQKGTGTEPPPPPITGPPSTSPSAATPPPPPTTTQTQSASGAAAASANDIVVTPPPSETTPPSVVLSPPPQTVDRGRTLRIAGIATAGVGAFMVLLGIIEYGRAKSASDEVNAETTFDPSVEHRGQSAQTAEGWFLTLGLLAGGGGAALWYFGHQRSAQAEAATYRVSVAPVISPGGGGAWLRVRF
jgi:tetratricopeptide (TPR) repeat protein